MTQELEVKQKLKGLGNIAIAKDDIYYLCFYDIDTPQQFLNQAQMSCIDRNFQMANCSYLIYKTKHGFHLIGLSPLNEYWWAHTFRNFKMQFKSYYSGRTIRLSRKKDELQVLIHRELEYGEVIPNLYNLFASRFNYDKMYWTIDTKEYEEKTQRKHYVLLFEKYRSDKE